MPMRVKCEGQTRRYFSTGTRGRIPGKCACDNTDMLPITGVKNAPPEQGFVCIIGLSDRPKVSLKI